MHSIQSAILFYYFCPSVRPSVSLSVAYIVSKRTHVRNFLDTGMGIILVFFFKLHATPIPNTR